MPHAICSSPMCNYWVRVDDGKNGNSARTPLLCPLCGCPIISTCPWCGFRLMGEPGALVCAVCRVNVRRLFEVRRARPVTRFRRHAARQRGKGAPWADTLDGK
jgi:hypothetical protein